MIANHVYGKVNYSMLFTK